MEYRYSIELGSRWRFSAREVYTATGTVPSLLDDHDHDNEQMTQDKSPYAGISHVPLIKSPSLRVPRPVQLPPDIHPLPESVTAYFAYPFTLEPHVLAMESSRRATLASHAAKRDAYLRAREDEKERRKREALRKIAPGFEPQGVLVPTRTHSVPVPPHPGQSHTPTQSVPPPPGHRHTRSVMDDLVDHLAALDSGKSS